ncbi:Hsp20/alpha crystallin family protein [Peribacillus sp. FSL H8-0477]|uniref:Hsp20/alpha crystallin family protein n=1 Tax=Peribacillus sp. FSL H8-0477 TaxID=2921388 RepID=UPI0030F4FDF6
MPSSNNEKKEPYRHEVLNEFVSKMDRLFADKPIKGMLQSMDDFFTSSNSSRSFPVEIVETEHEYQISASLPGVKRQHIGIEVLPQAIMIKVKVPDKANNPLRNNGLRRTIDRLSRTISLYKPFDDKKINAQHRDGILQLTVPKLKGKTISINE